MNKTFWLRLVAILVVLASLMSVFVACDSGDKDTDKKDETTKTQETTKTESGSQETEAGSSGTAEDESNNGETTKPVETTSPVVDLTPPDYIPKQNFNKDFNLSILPDTNSMDYFWVEESKGDTMSEAIFSRQQRVKDHLGVNIIGKKAGSHTDYIANFKTEVSATTGAVDTLLTHVNTGVTALILEGYLRDFADIEQINLDEDYWNQDFMDALSVADHYFLGFSDFNILYTYVITFNKEMLNTLNLVNQGYTEENLYKYVNEGKWTIDKFIELTKLGVHYNAAGQKIYGVSGQQWVPWIGFMQASDINLVEQNERGQYEISFMNEENQERTSNLVNKLKDLSNSGNGDLTYPTFVEPGVPSPEAKFTDKRALMSLTSTYGLPEYIKYEISFGVLPYPMYDENQFDNTIASKGYRSLQWGGYITIPSYLKDEAMTGYTLEMLSWASDNVKTTFYEKLLGKQVAEAPNDAKMLEIVWSSVCTDFGQTFSDECGTLYTLPYVTRAESGKELVSFHSGIKKSGDKKLKQFIVKVTNKYK